MLLYAEVVRKKQCKNLNINIIQVQNQNCPVLDLHKSIKVFATNSAKVAKAFRQKHIKTEITLIL